MKVLFLDDNPRACTIFKEWFSQTFSSQNQVTLTSNLVNFDYELYESGTQYDKYILDLNLIKPNEFQEKAYKNWLNEIGISHITQIDHTIMLPGWDYYQKVMKKRPETKDRLNHVMLKTGFAELLTQKFNKADYKPATLLSKGDANYHSILKEFLVM